MRSSISSRWRRRWIWSSGVSSNNARLLRISVGEIAVRHRRDVRDRHRPHARLHRSQPAALHQIRPALRLRDQAQPVAV